MHTTIIGIDLAKNVFQLHAEDAGGKLLWRKRLRREELVALLRKLPPALIGMEACGRSHHWGRAISALGHEVRLMHAKYVKAYVKRGKSDVRDAEAICEAVRRPNMRFVPIKSAEQQIDRSHERAREPLVKQRTQLMNAAHALVTAIGDPRRFSTGRDFAAWVGLTPLTDSSAETTRIGHISRQGDHSLRRLMVLGAANMARRTKAKPSEARAWLLGVMARRPVKLAMVAQAAKTARIAWALLRSGEDYRATAASA